MKIIQEKSSKYKYTNYILKYKVDDGIEHKVIVIHAENEDQAIDATYKFLKQYVGDYIENSVIVDDEINYIKFRKEFPNSNHTVISANGKILKK